MRKLFLLLMLIGAMSNRASNAESDYIEQVLQAENERKALAEFDKESDLIWDDYKKQEGSMEELTNTVNRLKSKIDETIKKGTIIDSRSLSFRYDLIESFYKREEKIINNRNMLSSVFYKDEIVEIVPKNIVNSEDSLIIILGVAILANDQLIKTNVEEYFEYENEVGGISVGSKPKGFALIDQYDNKYELSGISQYPNNENMRYGKNYYFIISVKERLLDSVDSFKLTIDINTLGNINPVVFNFEKKMILNEDGKFLLAAWGKYSLIAEGGKTKRKRSVLDLRQELYKQ